MTSSPGGSDVITRGSDVITRFISAGLAIFFLLIGFIFTPGNGEYMLQLFNNYPVTMPLLVVGITEAIAVGWIFGINK